MIPVRCRWRDSNPQPPGSKPGASANWATPAASHHPQEMGGEGFEPPRLSLRLYRPARSTRLRHPPVRCSLFKRSEGVEPSQAAWHAAVLPLYDDLRVSEGNRTLISSSTDCPLAVSVPTPQGSVESRTPTTSLQARRAPVSTTDPHPAAYKFEKQKFRT
jgi:hypothetical protein